MQPAVRDQPGRLAGVKSHPASAVGSNFAVPPCEYMFTGSDFYSFRVFVISPSFDTLITSDRKPTMQPLPSPSPSKETMNTLNESSVIDRPVERLGKVGRPGTPAQASGSPHEASLIVDVAGRITHCSRAAIELLGQKSEALLGRALAAVIEGLPMAPDTPGYNLAYAILQAAEGQWVHGKALQVDGQRLPVDILFSDVMKRLPFFITLTLKPTHPMYWSKA